MKALYMPLIAALLVSGCSAPFLQTEKVSLLRRPSEKKTSVVYFRKIYRYSGDGGFSTTEHLLLQAGENRRTFPAVVDAISGDSYKLTDFAARIVNTDGTVQSIHNSSLFSVNLSGGGVTQTEMVALPINGRVQEGDIIEEYMKHKITLPRLGMNFSLAEVGRGRDIECSVSVPDNLAFRYLVVNDTTKPEIISTKDRKEYVFRWKKYAPVEDETLFGPQDAAPGVLGYVTDVSDSSAGMHPWVGFGDWYLKLISDRITFDNSTKQLAEKITKGLTSPKAKMDALFNYCQKNIRYEQVYLRNGGYAPNPVPVILKRDYGDCKDYSAALYALAHSIGLKPRIALTFRGRGDVFYPKVPVNQFNHVLVYFRYHGRIYWYDGTDTQGIPGLTSDDLINQEALVLRKGDSRIVRIREDPGDRLVLSGTLNAAGSGFKGAVTVSFRDQYAVDPFYVQSQLDSADIADYFKNRLKKNVLSSISNLGMNDFLDQMHFAVAASGISSANTQKIDSLLIVTPNDLVLSRFRNQLYSSNRRNAVDLGTALSFDADFMISIPPGYTYVDTVKSRTIAGPAGCFAVATRQVIGNNVNDVTSVAFPRPYIKRNEYKTLISFLDNALKLEKSSIVFKKK